MSRWMKVGATAVGSVALGAVVLGVVAGARWDRATVRAVRRLDATAARAGEAPADGVVYSPAMLEGLPAPVARYFAFALTPGQPLVRRARIRWEGEFRLEPDGTWFPFTATQHFTVRPPGFVWDATMRMAPLVHVRVRDGYVAGAGEMLGKVAALVTVADQRGTPEMAAGALSRYLGEAIWLPTALLPASGVTWTPIDDNTARATLADGATQVAADFDFAPDGAITGASMDRFRDVNGTGVRTPFRARITGGYRRHEGMMVPSAGEVAWLLPEGEFVYWRGRVAAAYGEDGATDSAGRGRGARRRD